MCILPQNILKNFFFKQTGWSPLGASFERSPIATCPIPITRPLSCPLPSPRPAVDISKRADPILQAQWLCPTNGRPLPEQKSPHQRTERTQHTCPLLHPTSLESHKPPQFQQPAAASPCTGPKQDNCLYNSSVDYSCSASWLLLLSLVVFIF